MEFGLEAREQEELEQEEARRNTIDNEVAGSFFKGESGNGAVLWGQTKGGRSYLANRPFSFESETQQPGYILFGKIKQQLEAERKYNEQMKDKGEGDD